MAKAKAKAMKRYMYKGSIPIYIWKTIEKLPMNSVISEYFFLLLWKKQITTM